MFFIDSVLKCTLLIIHDSDDSLPKDNVNPLLDFKFDDSLPDEFAVL